MARATSGSSAAGSSSPSRHRRSPPRRSTGRRSTSRRPLGLDPATRPILDARLDDGSRVAICTPPASPHVAMTIRRFGGRAFSAEDLVGQGALPEEVFRAARAALRSRRNILVSGGTVQPTLMVYTMAYADG